MNAVSRAFTVVGILTDAGDAGLQVSPDDITWEGDIPLIDDMEVVDWINAMSME